MMFTPFDSLTEPLSHSPTPRSPATHHTTTTPPHCEVFFSPLSFSPVTPLPPSTPSPLCGAALPFLSRFLSCSYSWLRAVCLYLHKQNALREEGLECRFGPPGFDFSGVHVHKEWSTAVNCAAFCCNFAAVSSSTFASDPEMFL